VGPLSEENQRASKTITLVAAGVLLVGAVVFILESDSWYLAFKTVHVVSAVLWIGGGAFLTFMAMAIERSDDPGRLIEVARQVGRDADLRARLLRRARDGDRNDDQRRSRLGAVLARLRPGRVGDFHRDRRRT
jgi:hypothetical protein